MRHIWLIKQQITLIVLDIVCRYPASILGPLLRIYLTTWQKTKLFKIWFNCILVKTILPYRAGVNQELLLLLASSNGTLTRVNGFNKKQETARNVLLKWRTVFRWNSQTSTDYENLKGKLKHLNATFHISHQGMTWVYNSSPEWSPQSSCVLH